MTDSRDAYNIKKAVALRYRQGEDDAPVVVASGQGWLAEKIIEIAREKEIKLYQDNSLVDSLRVLNINEEIPVELYESLAAILAFVFKVDQRYEERVKTE